MVKGAKVKRDEGKRCVSGVKANAHRHGLGCFRTLELLQDSSELVFGKREYKCREKIIKIKVK